MQLPNANIRSSSYYIAERQSQCTQCRRHMRVLAVGLPRGHEMRVDDEWQIVDANAFIFHITELPDPVSGLLHERSAAFQKVVGEDPAESLWANHCARCSRPYSDDDLHCEPGGFMPGKVEEAQAISLTKVEQAFSAYAAGYALEPEFFASMARR